MKHHAPGISQRFLKLIAYDPLAGLSHPKKRRADGGRISLAEHIGEQAKIVDTDPSEGQKIAGNYKKGHIKVHGLDISIENPRGSYRSGVADGKPWKSRLPAHYGYLRKTEGGDGQHVDVYLGPHLKSPHVFVVDQHELGSKLWDEHKAFIGFGSKTQAREAYHRAFSDGKGRDRIGHIETMTVDGFKDWLNNSDTTQPIKGHRERFAAGGAVNDPEPMAGGGAPAYEPPDAEGPPPYEPPVSGPKTFSDRLSNMWEKATPGGPLWMAKQAYEGVRGSVDNSAAVMSEPQTEMDAFNQNEANRRGATDALKAVQFMTPSVPSGTGGLLAAPIKAAEKIVEPIVSSRKDAAGEFGINLTKGQSTQDLDLIRYEDMAARGAYGKEAQDRAAAFFQQQHEDAIAAGQAVGQQTARAAPMVDNPAEAAGVLNADVVERAARARAMQAQAEQTATTEAEAQRGMVADQGRSIEEAVRGHAQPIENPREAGEIVGQNVRDAATANRQEFRDRYDEFGRLPGEFRVDAVQGMGTRVRNSLGVAENPIIIDDQLTPAASRAIQTLDEMSTPRIQNRASPHGEPDPAEIAGINLRGIDQMRKKLVAYYQAARANPTDARAVQGVIHGFDEQIERAITEGLFSGDPRALAALQEARASYSRYRQTFGPRGAGDDVGTAMRRIVDRNATPEEVANMIIGSRKIGNAGLPVRIANRLENILGPDSDSWSAIRQAIWQKASQVRNSAGEADPLKSANSITDFLGSTLAQRMFSQPERAAMRSHAQGIRDLERVIEQLPQTQTANRVREVYQDAFGGADLGGAPGQAFRRMVEGTATPEEVTNGIFKVIGAGNPGNTARTIRAISRVVGENSETMAAVRQGVWQKLTQAAEGKDQPGAQKVMQSINEFLNGAGRTIAGELYSPKELALMQRYADALKLTIIPKYARTNSDTAPAMFAAIRKYGSMVMGALGMAHGDGGLAGMGVGKILEWGAGKMEGAGQMRRLNNSINDIAPKIARTLGDKPQAARVVKAGAREAPNLGLPNFSGIQGPMSSRADDKQQQAPRIVQ